MFEANLALSASSIVNLLLQRVESYWRQSSYPNRLSPWPEMFVVHSSLLMCVSHRLIEVIHHETKNTGGGDFEGRLVNQHFVRALQPTLSSLGEDSVP